ncbi:nonsense-mediated mRNA decay protein 2 isoform X1 [Helianthus annuus]|uniref:nonsense-mediated mRNA decay protein 2 isoform X1 n=1 Tax=Helianthus annuus TaxID=4232 RepID=UPI000B905C8E|nr:nonsense-mediated mRNA decay protein 2 isoform X1 [Helianthus annuus]
MEDSFNARVDKTFGSLQASSSSSSQPPSSLNSLWSLTDEEIERNKWLQDKIDPQKDTDELIHRLNNPKPYSPFLQGLVSQPRTSNRDLESDIQELDDDEDDDDDENRKSQLSKPEDHSNEEWDIRTSVGMDCTLDNEEEEDAFDKVAVGKEESADRFYMKDVNDYEVDIDPINELPRSFTDVTRDPRANHTAAKLRLKEDDESARKLCLQVSENNIQESNQIATESKQQIVMNEPPGSSSSVPDHVRNPSKYTHYTFDSLDNVDEESNRKAYMDFFNLMKKGSAAMEIEDGVSADSLTSVVFTPRKKSGDVSMKKSKVDGHEDKKAVSISIADSDEVCMMDEDELEIATDKSSSLQKSGRRYRTRGSTSVE